MLEKAIQIAVNAHKGQTDKAGKPYILHLLRVMLKGSNDDEAICGVLHDILEDTNWTISDLRKEGFSEEIINALQCVTKKDNEPYSEFISRISKNPLATKVKLNDLEDNMDKSRLNNINEKDLQRFEKYSIAYKFLKNKLRKI